MNTLLKNWPMDCPFQLQSVYIPSACSPSQIELLTKARLLKADIIIHTDTPLLRIVGYPLHNVKSLNNKELPFVQTKWFPIPDGYDIPCALDRSLTGAHDFLIPSPSPRLFWRCKASDYLEYAFSHGGQWQEHYELISAQAS